MRQLKEARSATAKIVILGILRKALESRSLALAATKATSTGNKGQSVRLFLHGQHRSTISHGKSSSKPLHEQTCKDP